VEVPVMLSLVAWVNRAQRQRQGQPVERPSARTPLA